jgi:hypothetical protein
LALLLTFACCKGSDSTATIDPPAPAAHHEDRHEPASAAARLELAVTIDGVAGRWQRDVFDRVPRGVGTSTEGEARDTWSLRELAHRIVGPNARVVAIVGSTRKSIDAPAWDDGSRIPILHTTKRGALKFRWTDRDGKWGETEVKDVTQLEIVSAR